MAQLQPQSRAWPSFKQQDLLQGMAQLQPQSRAWPGCKLQDRCRWPGCKADAVPTHATRAAQGAHHLDLMFSRAEDTAGVRQARAREVQLIRAWVEAARLERGGGAVRGRGTARGACRGGLEGPCCLPVVPLSEWERWDRTLCGSKRRLSSQCGAPRCHGRKQTALDHTKATGRREMGVEWARLSGRGPPAQPHPLTQVRTCPSSWLAALPLAGGRAEIRRPSRR